MPVERRREVLKVTAAHQLLVLEDNAYRDIVVDPITVPPSLLALRGPGDVLQLSTFSKCLAPGLRLGWVTGPPDLIGQVAAGGMFRSGGGANHFVALAVAELVASGWLDDHLGFVRRELANRRDALVEGLRSGLPVGCRMAVPAGGFFCWLELPPAASEADVVAAVRRHGVAVLPGGRFAPLPGAPAVRLAYSFHPPGRLLEAGMQVAAACSEVVSSSS
jgi:2-aminoadipate transaminase